MLTKLKLNLKKIIKIYILFCNFQYKEMKKNKVYMFLNKYIKFCKSSLVKNLNKQARKKKRIREKKN